MTVTFPIIALGDGEVSAPAWFEDVTEAVNDHETRISAVENPQALAELRQTVAQSIANNASTAITFTTEDADTVGGHDNVTNNTRYTCQSGYDGRYQLSGGIAFAANTTSTRAVEWRKNGSQIAGSLVQAAPSPAGVTALAVRTITVALVAGDYIELFGYQLSGGSLNTSVVTVDQSTMSVRRISN